MSLEHSPARTSGTAAVTEDGFADGKGDADYWYTLINEKAAAAFLGLTDRTMQGYRRKGGGSRFIAISNRCIRYRRIDLRDWAESRMRSSTSDPG